MRACEQSGGSRPRLRHGQPGLAHGRGVARAGFELAARVPAEPLRRASGRLGAGLLRTACVWWPSARPLRRLRALSGADPPAGGARRRGARGGAQADGRGAVEPLRRCGDGGIGRGQARGPRRGGGRWGGSSRWRRRSTGSRRQPAARPAGSEAAGGKAAGSETGGSEGPVPSTSTPLLDRRAVAHAVAERRLFVS